MTVCWRNIQPSAQFGSHVLLGSDAVGSLVSIVSAMTDGHNLSEIEHHAQALRWLDLLAEFLPETVKIEVSSGLLIVALLALWIWRRPG